MKINEVMRRIQKVNDAKPPKEWTLEERVDELENKVTNLIQFIMKFSEYNSIVAQEMQKQFEDEESNPLV